MKIYFQINLWGGSTSRLIGGHLFFVTEYVLHPQYDDWTLDNDVAVIRVDVRFAFNQRLNFLMFSILNLQPSTPLQGHAHVSAIPLPPVCNTACCGVCVDGPQITVAGWGLDDNNQIPENLRQVSKGIHDQADCNRIWGGDITSRMFCTAVEDGRDSCNGDSGSPITRSGIQVGVVSFGTSICGDGTAPAVYVRIEDPLIRNFIVQVAGI